MSGTSNTKHDKYYWTELFGYLKKHKYGGKDKSEEKNNENSGRLVK